MPAPPPVLKEQGNFFVNGEVAQTDNPGGGNPGGRIVLNQMYVEYAIPQKQTRAMDKVAWLNVAGDHQWNDEEQCRKTVAAVKSAGGKASFWQPTSKACGQHSHDDDGREQSANRRMDLELG